MHSVGGLLSVLVAFRGKLTLIEIKNPARPKSARKLTQAEAETIAALTQPPAKPRFPAGLEQTDPRGAEALRRLAPDAWQD